MMWLKCAVVSAAMITALSAQTWEVSPFAGYLRLSKKPLGSLNTSAPKDDDTKLTARQPGYGVSVTMNTHGYYGVEVGFSVAGRGSIATLSRQRWGCGAGDGHRDPKPGFPERHLLFHAARRVVSPLRDGGS